MRIFIFLNGFDISTIYMRIFIFKLALIFLQSKRSFYLQIVLFYFSKLNVHFFFKLSELFLSCGLHVHLLSKKSITYFFTLSVLLEYNLNIVRLDSRRHVSSGVTGVVTSGAVIFVRSLSWTGPLISH